MTDTKTTTTILCGDAREKLKEIPEKSVQMCVTSPPYYALRNYGGGDDEIGTESTPKEYIDNLVEVFREVKRVLKDDGTLWLNIGDSYVAGATGNSIGTGSSTLQGGKQTQIEAAKRPAKRAGSGLKAKDMIGIPWMLAFALRADGWYLRNDIIWHKTNPMPESVTDRCTRSHEHLFLFAKQSHYYFDGKAIKEPCSQESVNDFLRRKNTDNKGADRPNKYNAVRPDLYRDRADYMPEGFQRNRHDVWTILTAAFSGSHFATFPEALVEPCILAGSREGDTVLDPFNGAGTTGVVCVKLGRNYIGTELNPEYVSMAEKRIADTRLELEYGFKAGKTPKDTFEYESSLFDEMSGETA